ncbi:hypothetical protein R1sor_010833 [Riccia sorocarpa]|uniref:Uncharacterized protein n=1 Tax=Riccia sorocarpa TaxID=122646 RepID=A0ABD3I1X2_9MARC
MVVPKREFPFEEVRRRPVKARKGDLQLIYEATLGKLKDGALASSRRWQRDEPGIATVDTCSEVNPNRTLFCSVCCTADYGQRDDRSFCFDCRNSGGREAALVQPPAISFDHDVQMLPPSTRFRQSTLDYLLRGFTTTQRAKEDESCGMEIG